MRLPKFKREKQEKEKVKVGSKPETRSDLKREYNFFRRKKSSKKCMEKLYCSYFDNMCSSRLGSTK